MKQNIKSVLSLTVICSVMAVLLAVTNAITAPIIKEQENAAVGGALLEVLPDGKNFAPVDLSKYELPETVEEAYSEDNGGYVFKLKTTGYGAKAMKYSVKSDKVAKKAAKARMKITNNERYVAKMNRKISTLSKDELSGAYSFVNELLKD